MTRNVERDGRRPEIVWHQEIGAWTCSACGAEDLRYTEHVAIDRMLADGEDRERITFLSEAVIDYESGHDERVECRECLYEHAIPDGVEVAWR